MTTHSMSTPDSTMIPPAVYVEKLCFRYRSLDDDPQPKRKKTSAPEVQPSAPPQVIEDISFSLPAGKLMLIAGPSGCGKSTLLKCLNGLIPHSYKGTLSGEIQLHGRSIKGQSLRDLALQVGTMLQDPDKQILGSTVEQEIAFGLTLDAQRARGFEIDKLHGGIFTKVARLAPMLVPVVIGSIVGAEDIISAMELRCFGVGKRSWLIELHARKIDRLLILAGIAGFIAITFLNILGIFFKTGPLHVLHTQGIPAFLLQ